jgi:PPOX class probable F420-dependent enzyme
MTFPAEFQPSLQRARLLYLTSFSAAGRSGTVPVLFLLDGDAIYFCSQRNTLKVRRIQQTGRVTVRPGKPDGPGLSCRAELLESVPDLETRLLRTYRRRYPLRWLVLGPRLRKSFADGTEVVIRLEPEDGCG